MTGKPNLSYFRLELKEMPRGVRKGLWKQFLLSFAATGGAFLLCMALVWWLAG